jgi:hypothetical protein
MKLCSVDGCTNRAKKGGVCLKQHGVKVNRKCIVGCTNKVQNGGVCKKTWNKQPQLDLPPFRRLRTLLLRQLPHGVLKLLRITKVAYLRSTCLWIKSTSQVETALTMYVKLS